MAKDSGPQFGWRKGDPLTAENLNRNSGWQNLTVGPGLTMARFGNTTVIGLSQQPRGRNGIFPVRVEQSGGSAGTSVVQCSFTYIVADYITGTTLGTVGLTGNGNRIVNATMTAGTYGQAFLDENGDVKLLWVDERISQTNC